MATFMIKIEKEDIKTSVIGENIRVDISPVVRLIFSRDALEELLTDYTNIKEAGAI